MLVEHAPKVIAILFILLQVNYELRDFFFGKLKEADIEAQTSSSRLPSCSKLAGRCVDTPAPSSSP